MRRPLQRTPICPNFWDDRGDSEARRQAKPSKRAPIFKTHPNPNPRRSPRRQATVASRIQRNVFWKILLVKTMMLVVFIIAALGRSEELGRHWRRSHDGETGGMPCEVWSSISRLRMPRLQRPATLRELTTETIDAKQSHVVCGPLGRAREARAMFADPATVSAEIKFIFRYSAT